MPPHSPTIAALRKLREAGEAPSRSWLLEAALAEILGFEEIALTVSLNEYIELAKEYSGDKSYMFINGILTEILREMKYNGSFFKALGVK